MYAHDRECRIFCLDLTTDGRRLVERSPYAALLDAFTLELERETAEESGAVDLVAELRGVQGLSFCCGDDASGVVFADEHLQQVARKSRGVFPNRAALPDHDYYAHRHRDGGQQSADERFLTTLRREKDRHTSVYNAWRTFFAHEGGDVAEHI